MSGLVVRCLVVIDDTRMLARVGVSPVDSLVATVVREGIRNGEAIVTWNAGHCRFREENLLKTMSTSCTQASCYGSKSTP